MLCLKKRRTYSFTQGACNDIPRRSAKEKNVYNEALNMAVTTLPRKHRSREERSSGGMVLTVTEDTPADMLAGSMELLVQLPQDHNVHTQRVTVPRSTPMMDLLVQIATAHKLSASSYTLQAIGERGLVLPHQPNTPIGALDALQVKLLPKQGTIMPRKAKQANQPFETTFRLQVLLPRNQLYVSRVSPKMNLGKILDEVCREKNLDKNKYELRHPANLEETLNLSLSLQDYNLQEVTLYAKQARPLGAALSSQDIMALQRQEERRRQQAKQSVFGFMFRKSKESSLSIDSLGGRSVSPARSDETGRSVSPLAPPARPQRKRRPAPKPPVQTSVEDDESKEKLVISHSRNSSDSSGYHEASVLSDNPDSGARMPETLPRRSKAPCKSETSRKLAQTSESSKSLGNLAMASGGLSHGISSTSISSTGIRKKRAAPPPPIARPLSSAISSQALERIVDSEESLTSDIDISKSPSDIAASSKANSDIGVNSKANSDIGVHSLGSKQSSEIGYKIDSEFRAALAGHEDKIYDADRRSAPEPPSTRSKPSFDISKTEAKIVSSVEEFKKVETARVVKKEADLPIPKPRSIASTVAACEQPLPVAPRRKILQPAVNVARTFSLPEACNLSDEKEEPIDTNENKIQNDSVLYETIKKDQERNALKTRSIIQIDAEIEQNDRTLKHVESLDDIYSVSMKFNDEQTEKQNSLTKGLSCAVISTIPKCDHLTQKNNDDESTINSAKNVKQELKKSFVLSVPKRTKVFRSQSATNDFDVTPFEKHARHFTSHPEDFTCAMNPNFSRSVLNLGDSADKENTNIEKNQQVDEVEETPRNSIEEQYPPFVTIATNLACEENPAIANVEGNWDPQLIDSASGDRPTETDILLQKVSDTLSSSLPLVESPIPAVKNNIANAAKVEKNLPILQHEEDTADGIPNKSENYERVKENSKPIIKQIETNNRESLSSENNLVTGNTSNATIDSQQDTSDYVSATGDDLSITDWEYQLPAPPSAFRDNISPDFDGYDTITLRSVEAFKENVGSIADPREQQEIPVDSPKRESPIPPAASNEIEEITKSVAIQKNIENPSIREELQSIQPTKPKLSSQISSESRSSEASSELKKEVISELATKIENGGLSQSNGKDFQQDSRRTSADCAAPKIAPVDNTLSNFTITTYSRKKSLNIFEEESVEERRSVPQLKNSDERLRNKSSAQNCNGNLSSKNVFNKADNDSTTEEKRSTMARAQSVEHIIASEMDFKKPETKNHLNQYNSLLRRPSLSNGHEKSTVVHRSKSYITLANNSKYREDVNGEKFDSNSSNDVDCGRIVKSTSVTNLNQEAPRSNEKFSQWRDNILKRQEEPSTEKQLQSLQVLKSILPQLKSTQQTEENVPDSAKIKEHPNDKRSETLPEDDRIQQTIATEAETKPQKNIEEATTKRYKYTGPPAISLGSWSERPRVNVQLKMDTDYKFGANNTSGAKTVVNLNGTNGDRNDNSQSKNNPTNSLPKNSASISNGTATNGETLIYQRRDSEDDLAKKLITHTTASGFKKPTLNKIGFPEMRNGRNDDKPIVTSVALKKTHIERSDSRAEQQREVDDEKIDTKPVSFKMLTKTFGQEVCLRSNPKRVIQNRHSDYYGARPEVLRSFSQENNEQSRNYVQKDANRAAKRYTSVVGIQSQNNNNQYGMDNGESIVKNHTTNMKMNGLMPVVKGFKIQVGQSEARTNGVTVIEGSKKSANVPPPPPTMPIITGVTLKNSTARPKSMPISNIDPRDQLLESIRSFGGRDKLKNVNTFS